MMRAAFLALLFVLCLSPARAHEVTQFAAKKWIESADCASHAGAVLVLCRDGGLVPLADEDPGDDIGHALALGTVASLTGWPQTGDSILTVNAILNYGGGAILMLLLLHLRLWIPAIAVAAGVPLIDAQYHDYGPHQAVVGLACLAAVLPMVMLGMPKLSTARPWWLIVGLCSLATAALFRQAIGLMGLVATFAAAAMTVVMWRGRAVAMLALVTAALLAYETPYFVLRTRDAALQLPAAKGLEKHGIWHSLYIGLGVENNPFGITWDDASGFDTVRRLAPQVKLLSPEYYDVLRDEYWRIVREHPLTVVRIYLSKFASAMRVKFRLYDRAPAIPLWLYVIVLIGATIWRRKVEPIELANAAFICFFTGQAVLFTYMGPYFYPVQIFLLLGCALALDGALKEFRLRSKAKSLDVAPASAQYQSPGRLSSQHERPPA